MTDCRVETKGTDRILHLEGELLIDDANKLRSVLIDSLHESDLIWIDVTAVTAIDIPCLQLFCAAHKTATALNKVLNLVDLSAAFKEIVRRAGWVRSAECTDGDAMSCLWREERYDE